MGDNDDSFRARFNHDRGVRFFFVTLLLAITGIVREELTTAIIGIAAGALVLVSWGFVVWRRLRGPSVSVEVATHPSEVVAGTEVTVSFAISRHVPRSTIAASFRAGSLPPTNGRLIPIAPTPVAADVRAVDIDVPKIPRGLYIAETVRIESLDPLGLSRIRYAGSSGDEMLRVVPSAVVTESIPRTVGTTLRDRSNEVALHRSDELIEARSYHPGDDPHRIHWGMLAHTNELFLRIGDELPPPSEELSIALDLTGAVTMEQIDRMAGLVLGICEYVGGRKNVRVALFEPQIHWYRSIDSARWDWARLEPSCSGESIDLPPRGSHPKIAVIVTGGASGIAPAAWDRETVGVITMNREGRYGAIATVG